uniref:5'-nucleotidase surE n=1 Tax=Lygus hesperus TaxID=30085 RepID=A0A0A9YX69_LYGHE
MQNTVMKPNETVSQYSDRIKQLAAKAYAGRGSNASDKAVVVYTFLHGLKPDIIAMHTSTTNPKSLEEAIRTAQAAHNMYESIRPSTKLATMAAVQQRSR